MLSWCASAVGRVAAGGIVARGQAARGIAVRPRAASRAATATIALAALTLSAASAWPAPGAAEPVKIQQRAKLSGGQEIGNAEFGRGVALSADGATALVSGPHDGEGAGAVWVFTRTESEVNGKLEAMWPEAQKLLPPLAEAEGRFGRSIALAGDGETALIGDPGAHNHAGVAWVYTLINGVWTEQAELTGGEEAGPAGRFGVSVALSSDGDTAVVGAPDDAGRAGAAWVFTRTGSTWTQQGGKLTGAVGEEAEGQFGASVAVAANGETALVGAPDDASRAGAAWVFTRPSVPGSSWIEQGPKLTGAAGEEGEGRFGSSVALSAEGDTALIGAVTDNGSAGAAWVFTRTGSTWSQQGGKLVSSGGPGERHFGSGVALSASGDTALIGASAANGKFGGAWELVRTGGQWERRGFYVTPNETEREEVGEAQFGRSVALAANGETALVGGLGAEERMGAAWVFEGPPALTEPEGEETKSEEEPKQQEEVGKGGGKRHVSSTPSASQEQTPASGTAQTPKTEVQAVKVLQPVASASCRLLSSHLTVNHAGHVSVKLACSGNHSADGKLSLTVTKHVRKTIVGKAGAAKTKIITKTITIATVSFAVAPNKTVTATLPLNKTGRLLLGAGHGHLTAAARLAKLAPTPALTRTTAVQLAVRKPASKKASKR